MIRVSLFLFLYVLTFSSTTHALMFHHFNHSPEDWNEDWDRRILYLGTTSYSEKYALEFIIEKNFLRNTESDPFDTVELSKKLREWNPQIKEWNNQYLEERVYYRRKNPVLNIALGVFNRTSDEGFTKDRNVKTQNFGYNFHVDGYYLLNDRWSIIGKGRVFRLMELLLEDNNRYYTFPFQYGFKLGMAYEKRPWPVYPFVTVELDTHANLRVNPGYVEGEHVIEDAIENHFGNVIWVNCGINLRAGLFTKGFYMSGSMGLALLGDMEVGTDKILKDFIGIKFHGTMKQYIYKEMYLEGMSELIYYTSSNRFLQYQIGVSLGNTF